MYVKKFTTFYPIFKKDAHKRKLVPFFCLTVYIVSQRLATQSNFECRDHSCTCNFRRLVNRFSLHSNSHSHRQCRRTADNSVSNKLTPSVANRLLDIDVDCPPTFSVYS